MGSSVIGCKLQQSSHTLWFIMSSLYSYRYLCDTVIGSVKVTKYKAVVYPLRSMYKPGLLC